MLEGCFWNFYDYFVFLKEIEGSEKFLEMIFIYFPFWIKVYDAIFEKRNFQIEKAIGNYVRIFLEYYEIYVLRMEKR